MIRYLCSRLHCRLGSRIHSHMVCPPLRLLSSLANRGWGRREGENQAGEHRMSPEQSVLTWKRLRRFADRAQGFVVPAEVEVELGGEKNCTLVLCSPTSPKRPTTLSIANWRGSSSDNAFPVSSPSCSFQDISLVTGHTIRHGLQSCALGEVGGVIRRTGSHLLPAFLKSNYWAAGDRLRSHPRQPHLEEKPWDEQSTVKSLSPVGRLRFPLRPSSAFRWCILVEFFVRALSACNDRLFRFLKVAHPCHPALWGTPAIHIRYSFLLWSPSLFFSFCHLPWFHPSKGDRDRR